MTPSESERQIDELCDEFERALSIRSQPDMADFLQRVPSVLRPDLLRELLLLEAELLDLNLVQLHAQKCRQRFPELGEMIDQHLQGTSERKIEIRDGMNRSPEFQSQMDALAEISEAVDSHALPGTVLLRGTEAANRAVLFGILAYKAEFISREQLSNVIRSWGKDKQQTLDKILLEQGLLSENERVLIKALVSQHLKRNNNHLGQSLAAISSVGSVLEDLKRISDPDVAAGVGFLSSAATSFEINTADRSDSDGARFRILRPHAKGGLGQVSVAFDTELGREVALKEMQSHHATDQGSRKRFVLEAEITGGLEHPGIVPVYGAGTYADGRPYYAMRFVKGDSLAAAIKEYHSAKSQNSTGGAVHLELRRLLGRFIDVCNAIAYAHSRGVLHRDLKPGNIMLGRYGETLVVDWGLAKVLGQGKGDFTTTAPFKVQDGGPVEQTQAGISLGTPAYMSPEQAEGKLGELETTTDVYSLGVTLYHLLTGHVPFNGTSLEQVLRKVRTGSFQKPRQVDKGIPAPLEAICLKGMSLRPEDRYESPKQMAQEIENWLADEPVSAYPEPFTARLGRIARKQRHLILATCAALFVIAVVSTMSSLLINQQRARAASLAQSNLALAQEKSKLADEKSALVDELKTTNAGLIQANTEANLQTLRADSNRILALSRMEADRSPVTSGLLAVYAAEQLLQNGIKPPLELIPQLNERLSSLQGRLLSSTPRQFPSWQLLQISGQTPLLVAHDPFEIRAWKCDESGPYGEFQSLSSHHGNLVMCATPGKRSALVTVSDAGDIQLFEPDSQGTLQQRRNLRIADRVVAARLSRTGRWLGLVMEQNPFQIVDLEHPEWKVISCHQIPTTESEESRYTGYNRDIQIDPMGRWAIVGISFLNDRPGELWAVNLRGTDSKPLRLPGNYGYYVSRVVSWSEDGRRLATGDEDGRCRVWDVSETLSLEPALTFPGVDDCTNSITLSPDGQLFLHHGCNAMAAYELTDLQEPPQRSQHMLGWEPVFSPGGTWIFTTSRQSHQLNCWRRDELFTSPYPRTILSLPENWNMPRLLVSNDGLSLWHLNGSEVLRWSLTDKEVHLKGKKITGQQENVADLAISPDGNWVALSGADEIRVWNRSSFTPITEASIASAVVSPDGKWLAMGTHQDTMTLQYLDPEQSEPLRISQTVHTGQVLDVSFSSDNRKLVTLGGDRRVCLFNLHEEGPNRMELIASYQFPHDELVYQAQQTVNGIVVVRGNRKGYILAPAGNSFDVLAETDLDEVNLNTNTIMADAATDRIGFLVNQPRPLLRRWSSQEGFLPDLLFPVEPIKDATSTYSVDPQEHYVIAVDWLPSTYTYARYLLYDKHALLLADTELPSPYLLQDPENFREISISPDGKSAATGSLSGAVILWELHKGSPSSPHRIRLGEGAGSYSADQLRFSSDGHWLTSGRQGQTQQVWNVHTASPAETIRRLSGEGGAITDVAISGNGQWFATSFQDGTTRLNEYSEADGTFSGTKIMASSIAVSIELAGFGDSSQSRLILKPFGQGLQVVDLDPARLTRSIRLRAGRELRPDEMELYQLHQPINVAGDSP